MILKRVLLFYVVMLLVIPHTISAQDDSTTDSLWRELQRYDDRKNAECIQKPTLADTSKIKILAALNAIYVDVDPKQAMTLSAKQLALSEKIRYR